jgi:hypothetical protein
VISYVGDVPLFYVAAQKFKVDGIDNKALADEVLASQERMTNDPTIPLYEDTVFDPEPASEGAKLLEIVTAKAAQYGMRVAEQWSQIHQPLESTGLHHHLNGVNVYGFVYYVRVPANAGMLTFEFESGASTTIAPAEKELYIFPAWAKHKVSKNMSGSIRISISGNLSPM